jgi:hypothetical protein
MLVWKPEGKIPLGRPMYRWEDQIRNDLWECVRGLNFLYHVRGRWRDLLKTVVNLRVLWATVSFLRRNLVRTSSNISLNNVLISKIKWFGGVLISSRLGIFWLSFFVFFLSPSTWMSGWYLRSRPPPFPSKSFQFASHVSPYHSTLYTLGVSYWKSVVKSTTNNTQWTEEPERRLLQKNWRDVLLGCWEEVLQELWQYCNKNEGNILHSI